MAKLTRKNHKVFGANANVDEMGQFGSAALTTKKNTKDIEEIQELDAWTDGWNAGAVSGNRYPSLQERNGIDYEHSYQTGYLLQEGIPEWNEDTEYSNTSIVKALDGSSITLYHSLQDNNTGHNLTDANYWERLSFGGGLEVCDIGMSLFVDETKGLRRYLNGSIVSINANTQAFLNKLKSIVALYPSLSTTEENWQAEKTLSVHGQCGKFVINETAGTIRLPRITMPIQGLVDLAHLGEMVEQSLPNINGEIQTTAYGVDGALYEEGTYSNNGATPNNSWRQGIYKFSASRSSSIYKDGANVQQEQIQYPYFIQIATGQETEVDIVNEIELNNPYSLFDSKYSDHILNNTSWLRSNGQWNSGTVYVDAYQLLLRVYNGTETIEGLSVKAVGDSSITDYDFVIDTANTQFKLAALPMERVVVEEHQDGTQGYRVYNDGYCEQWGEAFVPGTGGSTTILDKEFKDTNYIVVATPQIVTGGGMVNDCLWIIGKLTTQFNTDFKDASTQNHIYWKASGYLAEGQYTPCNNHKYYYVGETVQNANLINAGRIEEQLLDKVDTHSLVNCETVIETYVNGTSGYRIWSDGYCEQWGKVTSSSTISLLKTYKDAEYSISMTPIGSSNNAGIAATNVQVNSFFLSNSFSWSSTWKTSGYLASGEY